MAPTYTSVVDMYLYVCVYIYYRERERETSLHMQEYTYIYDHICICIQMCIEDFSSISAVVTGGKSGPKLP